MVLCQPLRATGGCRAAQSREQSAAVHLGVVYTHNEVVDFIIRGADHLLRKHFGRSLADDNVQILDPATGTGTFITSTASAYF